MNTRFLSLHILSTQGLVPSPCYHCLSLNQDRSLSYQSAQTPDRTTRRHISGRSHSQTMKNLSRTATAALLACLFPIRIIATPIAPNGPWVDLHAREDIPSCCTAALDVQRNGGSDVALQNALTACTLSTSCHKMPCRPFSSTLLFDVQE